MAKVGAETWLEVVIGGIQRRLDEIEAQIKKIETATSVCQCNDMIKSAGPGSSWYCPVHGLVST